MTGRGRRFPACALWIVGLLAAAAALRWAGQGVLATPPLTEPDRWANWLESRSPVVAAFSLVRVAALATLWYVMVVTTIGAALRVVGASSLVRVTDRLTIAPVRRMLAGSLSVGLAASSVVAVAAPVFRVPVAAAAQPAAPSTTVTPSGSVTMHRLSPASPPAPEAAPSHEVPTAPAGAAPRWTVEPGQSFWSIAEEVLTQRRGRSPNDAEIGPYWLRLIGANRDRLADADDPDLIFPGQVFEVPAP